jgi:hypothetical protein
VFARRLRILVAALALAVGLGACGVGHKEKHPRVADANNDGSYVDAGPISYQLEVSRILNQYGTEDSQYLKGLPAGTAPPTATQVWYGVFLWAKNQTSKPQTTSDRFDITDTQGTTYYPLKLDAAVNPYTWTSQTLQPLGIQPGPDTTASFGPTQGQMLLFKIGTSAYANRPLTLHILGSSNQSLATISLDL